MPLTRPKPSHPRRGAAAGPPGVTRRHPAVAALLSLLAGAALLVFLRQYREDVTSSDRARVVVAASLVPKGTPGDVVLEKRMYRIARVRSDDVREGAVTDPNDLKGQAVTSDVFPGHQLTLGDLNEAKGKRPEPRRFRPGHDRAGRQGARHAREDRGGRSRRRDHHDGLPAGGVTIARLPCAARS